MNCILAQCLLRSSKILIGHFIPTSLLLYFTLIVSQYKRLQVLTGEPLTGNTSLTVGLPQVTINRKYIDLAKPKSGAPRLFTFTCCRISENKRCYNGPRFGVSGYVTFFSAKLVNYMINFTRKTRYRMNHEAMSAISVFQVKFTVEFNSS